MIRGRSFIIDRNPLNSPRQIFGDEDEVAASGAVRPLIAVMNAACRRVRAIWLRDQPGIAIVHRRT